MNNLGRKQNDGKFFQTTKRGEIQELKEELHANDKQKQKDAVKKVIANMTVGKDVSALFADVVNCIQTDNIELKKLVYLYVMNYAKAQPELAILAINTFRKDASDTNPLIRSLAVRTMGCIRLDQVTEYLLEPLRSDEPLHSLAASTSTLAAEEREDNDSDENAVRAKIRLLKLVVQDAPKKETMAEEHEKRYGSKATQLKERAVYDLTRALCAEKQYTEIVQLLTSDAMMKQFLDNITKAKCAKLVRQVLDIVCNLAPSEYTMQEEICKNIITWCQNEKRTFLRQRVEAKLASIWFQQDKYMDALELIDRLLSELKKLDDKQLLVETHLMESKIHFALRNIPKAKAALTASRTAANAIYVSPSLQAQIDTMSGTIHTQEGDYNTAHSYFLEAFEQLDQINQKQQAIPCLKYMMLCRILDSLTKALKLSAQGGVGAKSDDMKSKTSPATTSSGGTDVDISGIITGRQGVKYAGDHIEAMMSIANAASKRSLKDLESCINKYTDELEQDLLIKHHLHILKEQLLESNLIRIMEPYSCVELDHVAKLIEMPQPIVEKKLSQMILDGKFQGILDQGKGQLVVYEESEKDYAMEKGLEVIANMDTVVSSLFERSKALRTMML